MIQFDGREVRQLAADLASGKDRVGREAAQVVRAAGERTRANAQGKAPKRTGALAASIGVTLAGDGRSGGGMSAIVAANIRYAVFNEWGTSKMAPQPFMGPALTEEGPRFAEELARVAGEGLLG